MMTVIVKGSLYEFKEHFVLQEGVVLEPEVGSEIVWLIIIEYVVTIDCPSAGDPLMKLLIEYPLLGQLIVDVVLSRDLILSVSTLAFIVVVLLMTMVMPAPASD